MTARNVMYEIGMPMAKPTIWRTWVICGSDMPPAPRKGSQKAADDDADNATADGSNEEEQQPRFEVLKLRGFFHEARNRPNYD